MKGRSPMQVKDLVRYLSTKFDQLAEVYIDTSVDGGISSERPLDPLDVQTMEGNKVIFIGRW